MQTDLEEVIHLFEKAIGLNPKIINEKTWHRIINERMAICDIKSVADYVQRLHHSHIEFQECIEALIVPETWFFRDKVAIEYICEYACSEWLQQHKEGKLSILSLPCSSGEEPYSIAMALADNRFPPGRLLIDGVDISKKSLAIAEAGEYNKHSFRSKDTSYRDNHFSKSKSGNEFVLNNNIRKLVHFSYGNLLDELSVRKLGKYDIIFCRNLFIYFHQKAQSVGFDMLKRLLKPHGILVVSIAEMELARRAGFSLCGPSKTGALKLAPLKSPPITKVVQETPPKSKPQQKSSVIAASAPSVEQKPLPSLEKARQLADRGKINEARSICNQYLEMSNTDPSAYFLLGLIAHAEGDEVKAEQNFLKTVYLDADFYEALVYLSLLAENKGDLPQAEVFRSRAERAQRKKLK